MKCWIKYVLPVVMAFCLFLGSFFYSQASDAQGASVQTIDYSACITECPGLEDSIISACGDTYYYFGNCRNGSIILYVSPSPILIYGVSSDGSGKMSISAYDLKIYKITTDYSSYTLTSSYSGLRGLGITFDLPTGFSNHDVYDQDSGELFFHHPSPFQRVVRTQDWAAVMMEIIAILPLLILSLTSLLALRKGLRHILSFLQQA